MKARPNMNSIIDLKDDLEALNAPASNPHKAVARASIALFKQDCPKCKGNGVVGIGYVNYRKVKCFACNGEGTLSFRTSPEQRARAKANTQARKQANSDAWREANPAEAEWLATAAARGFEFAVSLAGALERYGHLTEGQLNAVRKCVARDADRQAQRAVEQAQRSASAPVVSVEAIEVAFNNAKQAGIKYPRLRLDAFVFTPAGESSKNAGAVYVKEGETYLGKVLGGKFFGSRECAPEAQERIVAVATDPKQAAVAYGRKFGACSVCGRQLTDGESIERGIGPICAGKYGW
jgi:Family of unknown function (DUF6011)